MAGLLERLFGKKEEKWDTQVPHRIEARRVEAPVREDENGQRWKIAKKWREDKAMEEPLVKRSEYKRRIQ
ncbi:MAG: hypothetical protein WCW13_00655 [archaeon]|jgi:hypothetical protein